MKTAPLHGQQRFVFFTTLTFTQDIVLYSVHICCDSLQAELERNISFLKEKDAELDSILSVLTEKTEIDVDEAVTTTAPIYKQ